MTIPQRDEVAVNRLIFGLFPVKFPPYFFLKNFYSTKRFVLNFRGSLLDYFWAIVLISAVISILEDFGSLLPARTVTVELQQIEFLVSRLRYGGNHWNRKHLEHLTTHLNIANIGIQFYFLSIQTFVFEHYKVRYVFPVVVDSLLPLAVIGPKPLGKHTPL